MCHPRLLLGIIEVQVYYYVFIQWIWLCISWTGFKLRDTWKRNVVQWWNICLTYMRPWVNYPTVKTIRATPKGKAPIAAEQTLPITPLLISHLTSCLPCFGQWDTNDNLVDAGNTLTFSITSAFMVILRTNMGWWPVQAFLRWQKIKTGKGRQGVRRWAENKSWAPMCILIGDPCFLSYPFALSQEATGGGTLPERGIGQKQVAWDPEAEEWVGIFRIMLKEDRCTLGLGLERNWPRLGGTDGGLWEKIPFDWLHHIKSSTGLLLKGRAWTLGQCNNCKCGKF